jgi:hypothetical protein
MTEDKKEITHEVLNKELERQMATAQVNNTEIDEGNDRAQYLFCSNTPSS